MQVVLCPPLLLFRRQLSSPNSPASCGLLAPLTAICSAPCCIVRPFPCVSSASTCSRRLVFASGVFVPPQGVLRSVCRRRILRTLFESVAVPGRADMHGRQIRLGNRRRPLMPRASPRTARIAYSCCPSVHRISSAAASELVHCSPGCHPDAVGVCGLASGCRVSVIPLVPFPRSHPPVSSHSFVCHRDDCLSTGWLPPRSNQTRPLWADHSHDPSLASSEDSSSHSSCTTFDESASDWLGRINSDAFLLQIEQTLESR